VGGGQWGDAVGRSRGSIEGSRGPEAPLCHHRAACAGDCALAAVAAASKEPASEGAGTGRGPRARPTPARRLSLPHRETGPALSPPAAWETDGSAFPDPPVRHGDLNETVPGRRGASRTVRSSRSDPPVAFEDHRSSHLAQLGPRAPFERHCGRPSWTIPRATRGSRSDDPLGAARILAGLQPLRAEPCVRTGKRVPRPGRG
jgi:hypothetical protein